GVARPAAPVAREARLELGVDRGPVRGDAGVPRPAPAEVADHEPVAAAGLAHEPFFGDPEPVVKPVGERERGRGAVGEGGRVGRCADDEDLDRKSTRLNSSHVKISYAVFSLKK